MIHSITASSDRNPRFEQWPKTSARSAKHLATRRSLFIDAPSPLTDITLWSIVKLGCTHSPPTVIWLSRYRDAYQSCAILFQRSGFTCHSRPAKAQSPPTIFLRRALLPSSSSRALIFHSQPPEPYHRAARAHVCVPRTFYQDVFEANLRESCTGHHSEDG